jgi:CBS domain-containing protein
VTDRDRTIRVLAEARDPIQTTTGDAMTRFPHAVAEETAVEEALRVMRVSRFCRLPVLDRGRANALAPRQLSQKSGVW